MKAKQKPVKTTPAKNKRYEGFTAEERGAMQDRVKEMKAGATKADEESAVLEKIAVMVPADRALGKRLHTLITSSVPALSPKLWYGMPAYAKNGKIVCYFQPASRFKTRYATLGFSDAAHLDEGNMWPNAYALKELTAADEARIGALVKKAAA